jgi:hypothetical protein
MAAAFRGSQLSQRKAVSPLRAVQMKVFRSFTHPVVHFAGVCKANCGPAATCNEVTELANGRRSFSELLNGNHLGTALIEPDADPGAVHIINALRGPKILRSPATAPPTISEARDVKLQEFLAYRSRQGAKRKIWLRCSSRVCGR